MLYGRAPAQKMYCVSSSEDLLSILRHDLAGFETFDYSHNHQSGWTRKDSSAVFGKAAKILGSTCLYGTWMIISQTLIPIDFAGIDGYVIGKMSNRYLVASSIVLSGGKTSVFT